MTDGPGALLDLHVHTLVHSLDSGLSPNALTRAAVDAGLSAVCITEHNACWTREEVRELSERCGLPVIPGMEVSTDAGHVLTFGLDHYTLEMYTVERLRHIVEAEGGAMVLAHPTRSPGFGRSWADAPALFEALECMNGDDHRGASGVVFSLAASLGMHATGGSDAHSIPAVARCVTRFEESIITEHELAAALREGNYHPLLRAPDGSYVVPPAVERLRPGYAQPLAPR